MLKRSILAVSCLLILGSAWSASAAVDPTLVGWWWFDEGGGTTAADSSGNKNNGDPDERCAVGHRQIRQGRAARRGR